MWPDEQTRAALAAMAREYSAQCGGRAVRGANIHLTLAFLGAVPTARIAALSTIASGIAVTPFTLDLSCTGYWRHNRVVWVGVRQCPVPLRQLAGALAESLRANGFRHETREYVPHITLLRDARRGPAVPLPAPLAWQVSNFVMVRSTPGTASSEYEIIGRWP